MGTTPAEDTNATAGENLTVHYIDVGQADSILLECAGQFMLIDGGNVADSSLVVSYLQKQGVKELELVVCTHAHEDHVGGLAGVLAVYPTAAVWAPTKTYDSKCFDDFARYVNQQGLEIKIPNPGDNFDLAKAAVTVLGPVTGYAETNNTSIVLSVQFGENRFLFTGDMERDAENDMLDTGVNVKADVLKVGHHGSETSTGYRFLYEVDPTYAVISVGKDNSYGHPHEEPMSRLRDADVTVYRTDEMGTVIAVSDGKNITFSWEKASAKPIDPTGSEESYYIGNKNSKTLHVPSCANLPAEKNQIRFESYESAITQGFTPCGNCMD
jgi:competence protein ComEC